MCLFCNLHQGCWFNLSATGLRGCMKNCFFWQSCDRLGVSEKKTKTLLVVKDDNKRVFTQTMMHVSSPIQSLRGWFKPGFIAYQTGKLSGGGWEPRPKPCSTWRIENPASTKLSGTGSDWILSPLIINSDIMIASVYFIPMQEAQGAFSGENHVCTHV